MIFTKNLREVIPSVSTKLPNGYSHKVKTQADLIIKKGINDSAPIRKEVEGITIDDINSLDLDDGIWAEKRKDGGYTIFVSIADPTEAIEPLSDIELEAINKSTSIYTNTHVVHMLPTKLSTDIVSLNHDTKRLSKTIQIDYDSQMNILNTDIYESIFHNKNRFDYGTFGRSFGYEGEKFHSELNLMWEIARKLREKRRDKAKLEFNESDRRIESNCNEIISRKYIASILIEEFMVAANVSTANYLVKNKVTGIFRAHMPDYKGIPFNGEEMYRAYYTTKNEFHYGLGEEKYMHTTSPIRRLADYMQDRFLKSHLRGEKKPYSKEEAKELTNYINMQISSIVLLERQHNFQAKIKAKNRKLAKNGDYKLCEIKEHIRNSVGKGLKLPKEIKNNIIEKIKNGKKGDWHWIIVPYLVSSETEIIEVLKEKVVGNTSPKIFFNIITENIVERKKSSVFEVKEKKENDKYFINIYYKGEIIIRRSGNIKIENSIRTKIIPKIFDYFIEKLKNTKD